MSHPESPEATLEAFCMHLPKKAWLQSLSGKSRVLVSRIRRAYHIGVHRWCPQPVSRTKRSETIFCHFWSSFGLAEAYLEEGA